MRLSRELNRDLVSFFVPSLAGGGAEKATVTLANGFAELGLAVDLVVSSAAGSFSDMVGAGVRIVDLDRGRVLTSVHPLAKYLTSRQPRALVSALTHANVAASLSTLTSAWSGKLILTEHTGFSAEERHGRARLLPWLVRRTYGRADAVVSVSRASARDLESRIGWAEGEVAVIYTPLVNDQMKRLAQAPSPHPWLDESSVILAVGRLDPVKGFDILIRSFASVRESRDVRLVILGEGPLRGDLLELATELGVQDDFALPGFVTNPYSWMSRAAVFALSSRREGLPSVLVEAMACGAPVVSTDCHSGPAEILENGQWGRLVPVGDDRAMAQALVDTLDNKRRERVDERAAQFSVDNSVLAYRALILGEST